MIEIIKKLTFFPLKYIIFNHVQSGHNQDLKEKERKKVLLPDYNNNRLFMVSHLIRAQKNKDKDLLILSHTHTYTHIHIHTHTHTHD